MEQAQAAHDEGSLEIESLEAEVTGLQEQIGGHDQSVEAMFKEEEGFQEEVNRRQAAFQKKDAE
jgi:hypothetical protein